MSPNPLVFRSLAASLFLGLAGAGAAADHSLPHVLTKEGRHELIVDGEPFLILGGQCHNSSAWPSMLPGVWAAIETLHANTLEAPVYWEQFEPEPGKFDPATVDALLAGAREHRVRLVLLWFGTWKNGSAHYLPAWLKAQPELAPRMVGRDGRKVDSPSPHSTALLEADKKAFRALMAHLRKADPQHTVILVQVENEPGAWNAIRDYSATAEKLFHSPVPPALLTALGRPGPAGGDWPAVFGADADEFFHAWSVGHFIGEVAAAGKAEYALPLYVNVALRDPLSHPAAGSYESGGATDNVLDLWKAAAPAIDFLSPDIYLFDSPRYTKVLELYARPDNPLFVPETARAPAISRYCYATLARGGIGWSPFGIDDTRHPGDTAATEDALAPFAANYRVLGPMAREIAQAAFAGRVHAAWEETDNPPQTIALGNWKATAVFGPPVSGYGSSPKGNAVPIGRALVVDLGPDEFLVTGYLARVDFTPAAGTGQREFLRVEEGSYENGRFVPSRLWNGDETDWGLNFGTAPQVLRVKLGTY